MNSRDRSFDDLTIGLKAELAWEVTAAEIDAFADLSGDHSPVHTDRAYARSYGYADRIGYGFLLGAKVSGLLGSLLPGRRGLCLEQTLAFPKEIYAGDRIVLRGEIIERWPEQSLVKIKIRAEKQSNPKQTVGRGTAICKIRN